MQLASASVRRLCAETKPVFTRREGAQLSCGRHTQQGRKNGDDGRENAIGHRAQRRSGWSRHDAAGR
ncbi:MAG: hypothetical protein ACK56F_10725, partial [bacterium]